MPSTEYYLQAFPDVETICAGTTLRWPLHQQQNFQLSGTNWSGLNLAQHVGDSSAQVDCNRAFIIEKLGMPVEPFWIDQVHGTEVIEVGRHTTKSGKKLFQADASYSLEANTVLAILTADCLPVLMFSEENNWIAAAHCGWRSLAGGILSKLVATAPGNKKSIHAWLGPAISQQHFQVGEDVKSAFAPYVEGASAQNKSFVRDNVGKYRADLYQLARIQLQKLGVGAISGGGLCTFSDSARFYSYRRQPVTGRMMTFIWKNK